MLHVTHMIFVYMIPHKNIELSFFNPLKQNYLTNLILVVSHNICFSLLDMD